METFTSRVHLLLSLQRALLGEVHPQLRQASIEAEPLRRMVRLRFEYDGAPEEHVFESCSCAGAEVMGDFPKGWGLDEQHMSVPAPEPLAGLEHVAYRRAEPEDAA